jgi:DNA-binding GntR family transcriptional regulator
VSLAGLLEGHGGLRITDPRRTSVEVHAHLRELIISGALPPGTELNQAELARAFAVSRTPLREAFRMLQEERLVSAELNQRGRVLGLDPDELELLYAGRMTIEALGVRLTAGQLTREESRAATAALREMDRTSRAVDLPAWSAAHHRFHRLMVARCGSTLLRTITSYAELSDRYVRSYQNRHPDFSDRLREHPDIFEAVRDGEVQRAVGLTVGHLTRTALGVMADFAPGRGAPSIHAAAELVAGTTGHDLTDGVRCADTSVSAPAS